MQKETTIDHALRATWQAVAKMYNEQAAKHGSTMATAFVLLNIDFENGTPSTSLGPQMGMEPTSLSRILKTMEEKGAIYREKNPEDGRSVLIKLTDYGKEMRKVSRATVIAFNEKVKGKISEEKLNHFFEVTEKINQLIAEREIFKKVDVKQQKNKLNGQKTY
ncbi:MarR family winged helix-turn-helix transcriptional regulator [Aureibaculum conchae]|uniref:MarR family winged helix-turn-helix transcriptional regulator n=1 Tax=Aureibaculum sp. 2308TA14-22 TaxID=3108392 RepID=UPI0033926605